MIRNPILVLFISGIFLSGCTDTYRIVSKEKYDGKKDCKQAYALLSPEIKDKLECYDMDDDSTYVPIFMPIYTGR